MNVLYRVDHLTSGQQAITDALFDKIAEFPNISVMPSSVISLENNVSDGSVPLSWVKLVTKEGKEIGAKLTIGADGANSIVR